MKVSTLCLLVFISACGGRQNRIESAERGLSTALSAVHATQAAFLEWDRDQQASIVAAATSETEGRDALEAHRASRKRVTDAFVLAYSSIALASSSLSLYAAGKLSEASLVGHLVEVGVRVRAVIESVQEIRGSP